MSERDKIISAGVANLKEFGYPNVNAENILTDLIYSAFFKTMLEGNLGDSRLDQDVLKDVIGSIDNPEPSAYT